MSERNDLTNSPPEHTRTAPPGCEALGPKPRGRVVPVDAGNLMNLKDSDDHSKLAASHLGMEERARQEQVKLGVAELLRQSAIGVESGALPVPIGRPPTAAADDSRAVKASVEKEMVVLPIKGWTEILKFLGVDKKKNTRRLRDLFKQFSLATNGPLRFRRKVVLADPRELKAWTRVINDHFSDWRLAGGQSQSDALKARNEELPDIVGTAVHLKRRRK